MPASPQDILRSLPAGVSLSHLARVAGMSHVQLFRLRSGARKGVNPDTAGRLRLAITRIRARQTEGAPVYAALYRSLLVICADHCGVDVAIVHGHDPARRRVMDELWMKCARVHWLARYMMGPGLGVSVSDVARAAGVSKQAVSLSLKEVELMRDQPGFDAEIETLQQRITGGLA